MDELCFHQGKNRKETNLQERSQYGRKKDKETRKRSEKSFGISGCPQEVDCSRSEAELKMLITEK